MTGVFTVSAQNTGIHFEENNNWIQVLAKAKAEHKYIFVDCYATWCVPCKAMETNIYPEKGVGDVYSKQFISVKLQMDKNASDNEQTKSWYGLADHFTTVYTVNAYPTFLFFDPDGNPVHKAVGSLDGKGFIQLAADAQNPDKQYYSILKDFQPGKLDTADEKGLAPSIISTDKDLAGKLAVDYLSRIPESQLGLLSNEKLMVRFQYDPQVTAIAVHFISEHPMVDSTLDFISKYNKELQVKKLAQNYIDNLSEQQLYTKANISFISAFTDTSSGRGFDLFYRHGVQVDTVMHSDGYSFALILRIARNEDITTTIEQAKKTNTEPDWGQISRTIEMDFGKVYIEYSLLISKTNWYQYKKDGSNYAKYLAALTDKQAVKNEISAGFSNILFYNNRAWAIFKYGSDTASLQSALNWEEALIQKQDSPSAALLDTKANLLYKIDSVNNKAEALKIEAEAVKLRPEDKQLAGDYQKMQAGLPTWPEKME